MQRVSGVVEDEKRSERIAKPKSQGARAQLLAQGRCSAPYLV